MDQISNPSYSNINSFIWIYKKSDSIILVLYICYTIVLYLFPVVFLLDKLIIKK